MPSWTLRRLWALTLLFFVLLVLWDATGFDLPLARWSGSPQGFALRQQPLFVLLSHELPRMAGAALLLALLVGVFKPWGFCAAWRRASAGSCGCPLPVGPWRSPCSSA